MEIDWEASVAGLLALSREGRESLARVRPSYQEMVYTTGTI